MKKSKLPERGTNMHIPNRFFKLQTATELELSQQEAGIEKIKTQYIPIMAKSMINPVASPDLFMDYSLNPYQGCEHGCTYCYARLTHNYWGYSIADEFETKILVKQNAVEVLKKELGAKNYVVKPIMLSGNTDCYQPAEFKFGLTRKILQLLLFLKHPVMLITKNALILRDLDVLLALNSLNLVSVAISVTASQDSTRRIMEPRASTIESRLNAISKLRDAGIPVHAMLAPIIPGINDAELMNMVKLTAVAGASSASYQIDLLNGEMPVLFGTWLDAQYPDRKQRILNAIRDSHQGQLNDSSFKTRMKGSGTIADSIRQQFKLAYIRHYPNPQKVSLRTDLFIRIKNGQLPLW